MAENEKGQPMDPSVVETSTPVVASNTGRVAYALKTLNDEVQSLFPETPVEYSDRDGRNTALSAIFDISSLDEAERFGMLLSGLSSDQRVAEVLVEDRAVLVLLVSSPRTQDDRSTFDLPDIWESMQDDENIASLLAAPKVEPVSDGDLATAFADEDDEDDEPLDFDDEDDER